MPPGAAARSQIPVMISISSLLLLLLAWVLLLAWRGEFAARVLIIGTSPLAHQLVAEMNGRRRVRHRVTAGGGAPGSVAGPVAGGPGGGASARGPVSRRGAPPPPPAARAGL